MNILFIGDIMGEPGRRALAFHLPRLREKYSPDFIIVNAENSAGGFGVTPRIADELLNSGIDVLTTGNHIWDKKEIMEYLNREDRILRPANYPAGCPGNGSILRTARNGVKVGVINLMGRVYMSIIDCPFRRGLEEVEKLDAQGAALIIIDMHAEATSEKIGLAMYLDGKVTAVLGTHTHVQTADERVLAGGTAFISDAGMSGPVDSIIGVVPEQAITRFLNQMPTRFDTAKGPSALQGVIITADPDSGLAETIERFNLPVE